MKSVSYWSVTLIPRVACGRAGQRAAAKVVHQRGVGVHPFEQGTQAFSTADLEEQARIAEHLAILRNVVGGHAVAEPHRFDEGRVSAADFGGLDVSPRVALQLAIPVTVDSAGEQHAGTGCLVQRPDVFSGIRGVADNH